MKGSRPARGKDAVKKDNASEQNNDPFHFGESTDDDVCILFNIFTFNTIHAIYENNLESMIKSYKLRLRNIKKLIVTAHISSLRKEMFSFVSVCLPVIMSVWSPGWGGSPCHKDLFKLVHLGTPRPVGKWAVGLRLTALLV